MNSKAAVSLATCLESKLKCQSERLEELHMEAAIDAELTLDHSTGITNTDSNSINGDNELDFSNESLKTKPIFDDYTNPNSIKNCLSPFVPSASECLLSFFSLVKLNENDVLLDIGSGDGRVCVVAAKTIGCRTVGLDISPLCIDMATTVARESDLTDECCKFYKVDATIDPDVLLKDTSPLKQMLDSVTVVYLFAFPTLLSKLGPLLKRLKHVRAVATLTYHFDKQHAIFEKKDEVHDIQVYSKIITS